MFIGSNLGDVIMTDSGMRRKGIEVPNKNSLPYWNIERKYSLSEFLDGWLEQQRVVSYFNACRDPLDSLARK